MRLFIVFCSLWMSWLASANSHNYKVVCYFGSWAGYRNGIGAFIPENINASLCTHLIYAFVGITVAGNVSILDPWNDLPDNGGKNGFARFLALKNNSKDSKFLVSIGGYNEGSIKYSTVVGIEKLRGTFVNNVVQFVLEYGFDGLDVNWEYPNQRGGVEADVEYFVLLLKELRERFDEKDLILTVAVGAAESSASLSYDIPRISQFVDFINLMTYDFHGSWDTVTGHNTPLYAATRETTELARSLNVNASVHYWLNQGALAEKIVLGIAFYGKSFTLNNVADHLPGSAISGAGNAGQYTQERGTLAYYEICLLESGGNWTIEFDNEQRVPYAYSEDQWVSYDNAKSIAEKAKFIQSLALGGATIWSIDMDDFAGICTETLYPLLNALNGVLIKHCPHYQDGNKNC